MADETNTKALDPVCGMTVDIEKARTSAPPKVAEHAGKSYYFCSNGCVTKFKAEPGKYLAPKAPAPFVQLGAAKLTKPVASGKTLYFCPMDPEVEQDHPGACPKCGMALEPMLSSAPATKVEYTCPMHPEIVRDAPGSCPICGMALERRTVTAHPPDDTELRDMTRRFWVSLAFTVPLLAIAMADLLPGMPLKH